jgi:hypothetical protein
MFIQFHKHIIGENDLEGYVKKTAPRAFKDERSIVSVWQYRINHSCDTNKLGTMLTQQLGDALQEQGSDVQRYDDHSLWIRGPDQFLLSMDVRLNGVSDYSERSWKKIETREDECTVKTMTIPIKFRFSTRDAIVYTCTPTVTVVGQISYALTGKIDPLSTIELLKSLGYDSVLSAKHSELYEIFELNKYRD